MKKIGIIALTLVFGLTSTVLLGGRAVNIIAEATSDDAVYKFNPIQARGGIEIGNGSERIDFHRRESIRHVISPELPPHISNYHCGTTGGGIVVAFNQKRLPNLLPGHNPGMQIGNRFIWAPGASQAIRTMQTELFELMGSSMDGVSINQYIWGLDSFASSRAHSLNATTVASNSAGISQAFRNAIHNGQLVSIFMRGFNIIGRNSLQSFPQQGHDRVEFVMFSENHIMIVFGYYIVSYFDANNRMFRQDTYLYVNDGLLSSGNARTRVNSQNLLYRAIITDIV